MISVLAVLIFIPASKHALENRSSAYWRSLLFELNNARSFANSRCRTLYSPNVTLLLEKLSLSILSIYIMNRRGERTQPCRSPTLTLKGFVLYCFFFLLPGVFFIILCCSSGKNRKLFLLKTFSVY